MEQSDTAIMAALNEEILPLVDDEDNQIGSILRNDLTYPQTYRAVGLWLEDTHGRVLLAQRAWTKKNDPGLWGPAVAGCVSDGEDYHHCAVREISEEIGIQLPYMRAAHKGIVDTGETRYMCQWYRATVPVGIELSLQEEEVLGVAWYEKTELISLLTDEPERFLPYAREDWAPLYSHDADYPH